MECAWPQCDPVEYDIDPQNAVLKAFPLVVDHVLGRMVTIAANSEGLSDQRTKNAFFIVEPNQGQLNRIGSFLEAGEIQPVVDLVVPFAQAGAAYAGKLKE